MQAIIKRMRDNEIISEEVVEPLVIMRHGTSYSSGGTYEYLELWTDSVRPKTTVKLDGYTEILIR